MQRNEQGISHKFEVIHFSDYRIRKISNINRFISVRLIRNILFTVYPKMSNETLKKTYVNFLILRHGSFDAARIPKRPQDPPEEYIESVMLRRELERQHRLELYLRRVRGHHRRVLLLLAERGESRIRLILRRIGVVVRRKGSRHNIRSKHIRS